MVPLPLSSEKIKKKETWDLVQFGSIEKYHSQSRTSQPKNRKFGAKVFSLYGCDLFGL